MKISLFFLTIFAVASSAHSQDNQPLPSNLVQGATHEFRTPDVPGLTSTTSACRVSDDPSYGFTPDNPIHVGGGAFYAASRSKRFLSSLRGPQGQGIHVKRLGSFEHTDDALLDLYQVEHAGSAHRIYIDAYRWTEPVAPKGLLCGASIGLEPPPPDPFETHRQRIRLAARLSTSTPPIPLFDETGANARGAIFDHARLIGRAVSSAAALGTSLDIEKLPAALAKPRFVVVAYPHKCDDGEFAQPESIQVRDAQGNSPRMVREARGVGIRDLVPDFNATAADLAVMYDVDLAIPGHIEITYATACAAGLRAVTLPIKGEAGRITRRVTAERPVGVQAPVGAQVRVQLFFDFDGLPQFAEYAGGPGPLAQAALQAAAEFRADPPRVNGAPLLQVSTVSVGFEP